MLSTESTRTEAPASNGGPSFYLILLPFCTEKMSTSAKLIALSVVLPGSAGVLRIPVSRDETVKGLMASVLRRSAALGCAPLASFPFCLIHKDTGGILFEEDAVWDVAGDGSVLEAVVAPAAAASSTPQLPTASTLHLAAVPLVAAPLTAVYRADASPVAAPVAGPTAAPPVEVRFPFSALSSTAAVPPAFSFSSIFDSPPVAAPTVTAPPVAVPAAVPPIAVRFQFAVVSPPAAVPPAVSFSSFLDAPPVTVPTLAAPPVAVHTLAVAAPTVAAPTVAAPTLAVPPVAAPTAAPPVEVRFPFAALSLLVAAQSVSAPQVEALSVTVPFVAVPPAAIPVAAPTAAPPSAATPFASPTVDAPPAVAPPAAAPSTLTVAAPSAAAPPVAAPTVAVPPVAALTASPPILDTLPFAAVSPPAATPPAISFSSIFAAPPEASYSSFFAALPAPSFSSFFAAPPAASLFANVAAPSPAKAAPPVTAPPPLLRSFRWCAATPGIHVSADGSLAVASAGGGTVIGSAVYTAGRLAWAGATLKVADSESFSECRVGVVALSEVACPSLTTAMRAQSRGLHVYVGLPSLPKLGTSQSSMGAAWDNFSSMYSDGVPWTYSVPVSGNAGKVVTSAAVGGGVSTAVGFLIDARFAAGAVSGNVASRSANAGPVGPVSSVAALNVASSEDEVGAAVAEDAGGSCDGTAIAAVDDSAMDCEDYPRAIGVASGDSGDGGADPAPKTTPQCASPQLVVPPSPFIVTTGPGGLHTADSEFVHRWGDGLRGKFGSWIAANAPFHFAVELDPGASVRAGFCIDAGSLAEVGLAPDEGAWMSRLRCAEAGPLKSLPFLAGSDVPA